MASPGCRISGPKFVANDGDSADLKITVSGPGTGLSVDFAGEVVYFLRSSTTPKDVEWEGSTTISFGGERKTTLSARVSTAYRSNYLTRVPGQNGNDVEGKRSTRSVDASMSYKVNKQLSFTLEGINLTDAYNQQYVDSQRDSTSVYHHTGREILLGARYKF